MNKRTVAAALSALAAATLSIPSSAAPIVYSVAGADPASIQSTVDAFRAGLGGALNPNVAGSLADGRREINWDGVPDALAAPNDLPANFFNVNSPRGVVFGTPGTGFQVSASAANPTSTPVEFGNLDPAYPGLFATFSPQRLFTALGSTIVDVSFFVPGSTTPAYTNGFGAVFTDVDLGDSTFLSFFGAGNVTLGSFFVPAGTGNETLSFLGVRFNAGERVTRVRIGSGSTPLAPGALGGDVVAMDDFIYGEPQVLRPSSVPEPASSLLALIALSLAGLARRRR